MPDPKLNVAGKHPQGPSLMKSLLFNTNHLIYFFCPLLLCLISFPSVSLHYCLLSHAIDFGEYGYYYIKIFESLSSHCAGRSSEIE